MPLFVVCLPAEGASAPVAPCGEVGGVFYAPVAVEIPSPGSVHYGNANQLFAYGFSFVITAWLLGIAVGIIMSLVRKG